jgi:hypothetical protein
MSLKNLGIKYLKIKESKYTLIPFHYQNFKDLQLKNINKKKTCKFQEFSA